MENKYHTLLVRDAGKWCIAFGDYSLACVKEERAEMRSHHKAKDLKIITTDDGQTAIDEAIAKLAAQAGDALTDNR